MILEILKWRTSNVRLLFLVGILVFLPFSYRIVNIISLFFLLHSLYLIVFRDQKVIFYQKSAFYIPVSIVVVSLIGLGYSSYLNAGYAIVERLLPLVIYSFIFSQEKIQDDELNKIKYIYIHIFLFIVLALEFRIIWLLISSSEQHEFTRYFFSYYYTYENLTTSVVVQPVYFGAFIVLSNIFCFSILTEKTNWLRKFYYSFVITLNSFFLFQLAARSSLLINIIIVAFYITFILFRRRRVFLGLVILSVFIIASSIIYLNSGFARLRMDILLNEWVSNDPIKVDPESRSLIWMSAWQVIKANPFFGVGTGDGEELLIEQYKLNGFHILYNSRLNAHNQYMTFVLRHGFIAAMIIIVANLFIPMTLYWKQGNIVAFLFVFLISFFFMTENVLGRSQGVVFFSLFHSIFLNQIKLK